MTGLAPDTLRAMVSQPATHLAVFDYLFAHEPDLFAAAEALALDPADLVAARQGLRS